MANCLLRASDSLVRPSNFEGDLIIEDIFLKQGELIDVAFDRLVKEKLAKPYVNIFIPLSIGKIYTDFSGLRLALHIRTTENSANQLANIILYGAFTQEELPKEHEFLSILLTKGVFLADYSIDGIKPHILKKERILVKENLNKALQKVPLKVPEHYFDSHSIANIWGLFRLLDVAGVDYNTIESIKQQTDKLSGIYFKWLLAQRKHEVISQVKLSPSIQYNEVLLIDDESGKGWCEVLASVLQIPANKLTAVSSLDQALSLLSKQSYQLIFLDLRLGEADHSKLELSQYGGYELLKQHIRKVFTSLNFSTPVILLTASNKAWNISEMISQGADEYYIKEHPRQNNEFTLENYERLITAIPLLIEQETKRKIIWQLVLEVETLAGKRIQDPNIKGRITEKLRMGYNTLFRKSNQIEKSEFVFNNEILAYLVFWSVMEEISYDFYDHSIEHEWTLKSTGTRLQWVKPGSPNKVITLFNTLSQPDNEEQTSRADGIIFLSKQISGILRYQFSWPESRIKSDFKDTLNEYRNRTDFIHSSPDAIKQERLIDNQDSTKGFDMCLEMFSFLKILLS